MIDLFIENQQDKVEIGIEVNEAIQKVCEETLAFESCDFDAQISVTIVDNAQIQQLNKQFREKDMPTDVLSFPMLEFDEEGHMIDSDFDFDEEEVVLGDIVISAERAAEQAQQFGHSFLREMSFLTVHSMLHLLGYDHVDDPEGEKIMCEKQEEILKRLHITRGE